MRDARCAWRADLNLETSMPAPNEPDRRFTLALTAAVAATTVAIGVTAATLLGWLRTSEPVQSATAAPAEPAPAPAVVYVPIAPSAPPAVLASDPPADQLAMDADREHEEHEEHGRHHDHEREHDDD